MRLTLPALALLLLPACDAADKAIQQLTPDAGPTGVTVDAEPSTPVAELDSDALCEAFYRAVTNQIPAETRCVPIGIIASGESPDDPPQTTCEGAVTTCARLAGLGQQAFEAIPTGPCVFSQPDPDACDATLETLQPCLDGMADLATGQIRTTFTCQLAGNADIPELELEIPDEDDVEACAAFTAACPDFFGRPD